VTDDMIIKLGEETLKVTAMVASPMLLGALVVGLVVSILQAITQINEATLTFIPKMAIVGVIFMIAAPWMMDQLSSFTIQLFSGIADFVRN
jgi:flagellar biosynthetic protein FliQ